MACTFRDLKITLLIGQDLWYVEVAEDSYWTYSAPCTMLQSTPHRARCGSTPIELVADATSA